MAEATDAVAKLEEVSPEEQQAKMVKMGLHVFNPAWQATENTGGKQYSASFKECTLQIAGTDETYTFPAQTCTRIADLREALSSVTLSDTSLLKFITKRGCSFKTLSDVDEVASKMTVKGLKSFKPIAKEWPHPIGIIGAGYHGLKTAMTYAKDGNFNFVVFDRNDRVGGYCWITGANRTSKLQTEFGSFHIWWGEDFWATGKCGGYPGANDGSSRWNMWPKKPEILEHFQYAAEEYGVLPYCKFSCNVSKLQIVGDPTAESRRYDFTVNSVKPEEEDKKEVVPVSVIYNYPGSLTKNRIIEYPGEDTFDGHIRYGMNDDTPYDKLDGATVAILGNGAFAVENARTCIESGSIKTYIVTRRKNLASPRAPCWFVHQGPSPTPGGMVLKMFEPMYELVGFGDPWNFWSVHASSDRKHVSIVQNSRFGIGDVTFLMCAWGRLEYVVDTVKRMSKHTLHLNGGGKIENVTICLKALGLLGDFDVDRLHGMKEMVGNYVEGDWRRVLMIDATGMNAANFTTFSTGIGTKGFVADNKYFHDHPSEMYKLMDLGYLAMLPRHKAELNVDKPAYVTDVKYAMTAAIIMGTLLPKMQTVNESDQAYKHRMYHAAHNVDRMLKTCTDEWFGYQDKWRKDGYKLKESAVYKEEWGDTVPYPYNRENMQKWFEDYSEVVGWPISIDGPKEGDEPPPRFLASKMLWGSTPQEVETLINSKANAGWWSTKAARNARCHTGIGTIVK